MLLSQENKRLARENDHSLAPFFLEVSAGKYHWYAFPLEVWTNPFQMDGLREDKSYCPLQRAWRKWRLRRKHIAVIRTAETVRGAFVFCREQRLSGYGFTFRDLGDDVIAV